MLRLGLRLAAKLYRLLRTLLRPGHWPRLPLLRRYLAQFLFHFLGAGELGLKLFGAALGPVQLFFDLIALPCDRSNLPLGILQFEFTPANCRSFNSS